MGGCVADVALMYALMANTGQRAATAAAAPPVLLPAGLHGQGDKPLAGRKAGVAWKVRRCIAAFQYSLRHAHQPARACSALAPPPPLPPVQWFDDAAPAVAHACNAAISLLEARGLEVVEVALPELALLRAAHSCTITSEMRNNMNGGRGGGGCARLAGAVGALVHQPPVAASPTCQPAAPLPCVPAALQPCCKTAPAGGA